MEEKIKINLNFEEESEEANIYYDLDEKKITIVARNLNEVKTLITKINKNFNVELETKKIVELNSYTDIDSSDDLTKAIENVKLFKDMLNKNQVKFEEFLVDKITQSALDVIVEYANILKVVNVNNSNITELKMLADDDRISDDVFIKTKYNYLDNCTKKELKDLVNYIYGIKSYVDHFSLSPLEKCIFVYDLLRERKYNENEDAEINVSRSLFEVYNSEYIVCVGFTKIYSIVLELLGINNTELHFEPIEGDCGHYSNLIYLDDDKYDEHKVFEVDVTWGRIANLDGVEDYKANLCCYKEFGNTINQAKLKKKAEDLALPEDYSDTQDGYLSSLKKRINRMHQTIKLGAPAMILQPEGKLILKGINDINNIINNPSISEIIKKIIVDYENEDYEDLYNQSVIANKIINNSTVDYFSFSHALYHVKCIEHSIDKDKYPFNSRTFAYALTTYQNGISDKERLLIAIFGENKSVLKLDDIKKDAAHMELISVLHKLAGDKINENPIMPRK